MTKRRRVTKAELRRKVRDYQVEAKNWSAAVDVERQEHRMALEQIQQQLTELKAKLAAAEIEEADSRKMAEEAHKEHKDAAERLGLAEAQLKTARHARDLMSSSLQKLSLVRGRMQTISRDGPSLEMKLTAAGVVEWLRQPGLRLLFVMQMPKAGTVATPQKATKQPEQGTNSALEVKTS